MKNLAQKVFGPLNEDFRAVKALEEQIKKTFEEIDEVELVETPKGAVVPVPVEFKGVSWDEMDDRTKNNWLEGIGALFVKFDPKENRSESEWKKLAEAIQEAIKRGQVPWETIDLSQFDLAGEGESGTRAGKRLKKALDRMPSQGLKFLDQSFELIKKPSEITEFLDWFIDRFPEEKRTMVRRALKAKVAEL